MAVPEIARTNTVTKPADTASTISLIGMPGAGKSTVGVILAKLTGLRFVDTDLDIPGREQATLQEILESRGYRHLRAVEQEILLSIETHPPLGIPDSRAEPDFDSCCVGSLN